VSAGTFDAFVVRFKDSNVVVIAKRGCIKPKVFSFPAEVHPKKTGGKPYTKEKQPGRD
jgi:hypothetical protein